MSEDCLSLNTSRLAGLDPNSDSKLPVVVWLNGGSVVKGSAYDPHFDPIKLIELSISDRKPIIYVALNYRLTIFGFARSPLLKNRKSLKVGIRDQRMRFQWIKGNIAAFGGDPELITAFGLSAGGTSISLHTMAFGGEEGVPFNQAWVMSGPPRTALDMTSDATEKHTRVVAAMSGCGGFREEAMVECMRALPMEELLETVTSYAIANRPPMGLFTFIPSVDDDLFPASQSDRVKAGRFVKSKLC